MKTKQPLVSVIMPVYNAGRFVEKAVESILSQTYRNIELIAYDDFSTDDTYFILSKIAKKDKRIKLFRNEKNLGVSNTVKRAIDNASGDFLARMDADDIAFPTRLQKQVDFLESNRDVVGIGAQCQVIDEKGKIIGAKSFPTEFKDIYRYIFEFVPLQQPTLMIAVKRLPHDFQFYRDGMNTAEEIELIFKLFQYGKVENLPDTLLKYRIHSTNTSFKNVKKTFFLTLLSRARAVILFGYQPTVRGIFVTIAETILVFLLPKSVLLMLYSRVRHLSHRKATLSKAVKSKVKSLALQSLL